MSGAAPMARRARTSPRTGTGLLALALAACSGGEPPERGPVELVFRSDAAPATYRTTYDQEIAWGSVIVRRTYATRHVTLGPTSDGDAVAARLDSVRIAISTPHGAETLDARHLVGSEFLVRGGPRGGPPAYTDEPVFEMPGMLEQRVAMSRLFDYGFLHLPDTPVEPDDVWVARHTREQAEAQLLMPADLTTEYRFTGWEACGSAACARIEGRMTGSMTGRGEQPRGPALEYSGTLTGTLVWLFDPAAGRVVSVAGEEISDGVIVAGGAETAIGQTTKIDITVEAGA